MKTITKHFNELAKRVSSSKKFLFILIIVLAVSSYLFISNLWNTAIENASNQAMSIAKTAEASISKELLAKLDVSEQDINKPEYKSLKANLTNIIKVNNEFSFAYIYIQKSDRIYFVVDSEPADSEDYSPPGQEYTEATEVDKKPFQDGLPFITPPTTDRWGTWISMLVPMKDTNTGEVIAVFGMDYSYKFWNQAVLSKVIPGVIYAIALFLLIYTVYIIIEKNQKMRVNQTILQESEEKYRRLSDVTFEGIVIYKKSVIQDINPSLLKMLGYQREEMLNKDVTDFIYEDDKRVVLENAARNYSNPYEIRVVRKNGEIFLAEVEGREYQLLGETLRVASIRDITKRKQTEDALKDREMQMRSITDSAYDAILMIGPDENITYWNLAAERIFGYKSDEAIGNNLQDLIAPSFYHEAQIVDFMKLFMNGKGKAIGKTLNLEAIRKDQTIVSVQLSLSAVKMSSGWHAIGIMRDVSEQKKSEEELINAKTLAEEATNAKSEFLANMSHEIRTPMNAVIGFSELMKKTDMTVKQRDYINKIDSSAKSLLGIINDILDFSKIEAGKLELENVDFQLDDVINNIISMNSNKASEKNIELINNIEPNVPNSLIGDPLRVGQILLNLVNNAVKFTDKGHVLVETELIKLEGQTCRIKFAVSDSGIGLTAEQKDKLFSAFSQADTSVTRRFGGTGLGLTISKRLVEMMNGKISVESEFGSGSTFAFILDFTLQSGKVRSKISNRKGLQHLKILIVDDNEVSRQILKEQIDSFGIKAVAVASGREAILEVKNQSVNNPYDLIIMDWRMPEMDGIEAADTILSDTSIKNMPMAIMVSAFGREEVARKAESIGISNFLMKPINQSLLFDTIMNLFEPDKKDNTIQSAERGNEENKNDRLDGIKILLVEDNVINQEVATEILGSSGASVEIANNGKEAVEAVEARCYDLVLMDLQMPIMGGYEASKLIRADSKNKDLPIIAMTAHAMQGVQAECIEAGMNDYVSKPIDPSNLFATIKKWAKPIDDIILVEPQLPAETDTTKKAATILPESIPGLDLQAGIGRVNGNSKLYRKLLVDFGNNYTSYPSDIRKALAENNREEAKRYAHTLKGVAGNISADEIHGIAAQLEQALTKDAGDNPDSLISDLDAALKKTSEILSGLSSEAQSDQASLKSEIDGVELESVLKELARLVWEDNIDAENTLDKLKKTCGSRFTEEIAQIAENIEEFDFDTAKTPIGKIANEMNIRLDGEVRE